MGMEVENVCFNIMVSNIVNVNLVSSSYDEIYWVCYLVFVMVL